MKFTVSWLKDHLDTDADLDALLDRLTMVGLEVEKVTDRGQGLETFVVGHVLEAVKHPNADKQASYPDLRQLVCFFVFYEKNNEAGIKLSTIN